jgi:hypothetical protein
MEASLGLVYGFKAPEFEKRILRFSMIALGSIGSKLAPCLHQKGVNWAGQFLLENTLYDFREAI